MSVDVRVHITSGTLQERAVLRRYVGGGYVGGRWCNHRRIAIKGHNGDEIRLPLADLGAALRALKVKPADLGYPAPRKPRA